MEFKINFNIKLFEIFFLKFMHQNMKTMQIVLIKFRTSKYAQATFMNFTINIHKIWSHIL